MVDLISDFFSPLLGLVSSFLCSQPMIYFVGIYLVVYIGKVVSNICSVKEY